MAVVETEQAGKVRFIRLNRPEKMNALNQALAWGVLEAVKAAQADEQTWVIGITGAGKAFCAGLDLTAGEQQDASGMSEQDAYLDDLGWVSRLTYTLREECDKPIVCGINGVAVGAGLALALGGDIKIMAKSARLMAGYPRIGGSPDGGLSYTLGESLGYEQAMRFLLENRTVLGPEAHAMGMVGETVAD
ncbi:MAG: enoyl-CoA hydratase/isomerase family protein, partial [Chromatiales bacterium]|nr:enoyl-CoA hydratase/isomerase family protein [Chromatiales bacterium]